MNDSAHQQHKIMLRTNQQDLPSLVNSLYSKESLCLI